MNYNRVILGGRLTRDIELRHTPSTNTAVATIGLAINERYTSKTGETKEDALFVDAEAFGRTAEVMAQYLHKGSPVLIEGRLKLDQWEDKQSGQKRSRLKVLVSSFQFVGGRDDAADRGGSGGTVRGSDRVGAQPLTEDEIPF